ncbi:hypothetical protein TNCV_4571891 [Trichonephila clavipes]|nr:hypothetical protein TNCV_3082381 [Trichonephila clavipes]GFT79265.1 hypothetical protein TNCV_4571891 [Trichonephila clavipes]
MGITIYMNEKECRPVMIKIYHQCESYRAIYCPPDGKLGMVPKLVSDAPAYCLQAQMEWDSKEENRVQICYACQSDMIEGMKRAQSVSLKCRLTGALDLLQSSGFFEDAR